MNYLHLAGEHPVSDDAYARFFIENGGDPRFIELGFGTWASSVLSLCFCGERCKGG